MSALITNSNVYYFARTIQTFDTPVIFSTRTRHKHNEIVWIMLLYLKYGSHKPGGWLQGLELQKIATRMKNVTYPLGI